MIPTAATGRCGGLPPETISKYLKTTTHGRTTEDKEPAPCIVCLEDLYRENEANAILECGHEYHVDCIKQWLQKKNFCPVCNAKALPVKENREFIAVQIEGVEGQDGANRGNGDVESSSFGITARSALLILLSDCVVLALVFVLVKSGVVH